MAQEENTDVSQAEAEPFPASAGLADAMIGQRVQPMRLDVPARGASYEDLHNQLTRIVSGTSLLHAAVKNSGQAAIDVRHELASADEGEKELLEEQLAALDELVSLSKSGSRDVADRVLNRKKVDEQQAADLLKYLQRLVDSSDKLGDRLGLSLADILEDYAGKIGNRRLDAGFRRELFKELGGYLENSPLSSMQAAKNISEMLENGIDVGTGKAAGKAVAEVRKLLEDTTDMGEVHDISRKLADSELTSKESLEELRHLSVLLEEMDGFAEEQAKLAELSQGDVERNTETIADLKRVLWKLSDRTVETKTLHTLNQIDSKFDKSILNSQELEESITKNSLGRTFLENPGKVATGQGGALALLNLFPGGDILSMVLGAAGLGNLGLADMWVGSKILGGAGKRVGKGLARLLGRGGSAAVPRQGGILKGMRGSAGGALKSLGGALSSIKGGGLKTKLASGAGLGIAGLGTWLLGRGDEETQARTVDTVPVADEPETGNRQQQRAWVGREIAETEEPRKRAQGRHVETQARTVDTVPLADDGTTWMSRDHGATAGGVLAAGGAALALDRAIDRKLERKLPKTEKTGKFRNLAKTATKSKIAKVGGRALGPLMAAIDYGLADSTAERKTAVGGGLGGALGGAAAGAAIGSVVPVVGTAIGGIAGGILGYFGGAALTERLFVDAKDKIPDKIRNMGPLAEKRYAEAVLSQGAWLDMSKGHPVPADPLTAEETKELAHHAKGLLAPANVKGWLASSKIAGLEATRRMPAVASMLSKLGADVSESPVFFDAATDLWGGAAGIAAARGEPRQRGRIGPEIAVPPAPALQSAASEATAIPATTERNMPVLVPEVRAAAGQRGRLGPEMPGVRMPVDIPSGRAPGRPAAPRPLRIPNEGSSGGSVPSTQPDEFGIALARSMIFN